jgi:hypothetical protein
MPPAPNLTGEMAFRVSLPLKYEFRKLLLAKHDKLKKIGLVPPKNSTRPKKRVSNPG